MAKIKDTELQAVLAAVEADLEASYAAEKANLAKAEPGEKSPGEAPGGESGGPPSPSPSASPASSDSDSAPPPPGASPEGPPPGADASAPPQDIPGEQGGEQPGLSVEALAAEYAQLPPEEFQMHAQALQMAMEAQAAQGPGGGPPGAGASPSAPPMASPPAAPPPAAASPSAPPMPPQAMKSEVPAAGGQNGGGVTAQGATHEKASGGKIEGGREMSKSEPDPKVAALEALVKAQALDLANVGKILEHMLTKPVRKALVSVTELNKNETEQSAVTPQEAKKKLFDLIPSLSKSERQTVLDFYEGRAPATKLASILAKIQ